MNHVFLVGRITADPELKQSPNGTYYCQFTLAVNRPRTPNNQNPGADFVPVVVFNGQAQSLAQHIKKGRQLAVAGVLRVDTLQYQDGSKKTSIRVIANRIEFLGSKPADQQPAQKAPATPKPAQQANPAPQTVSQPAQSTVPSDEDFGTVVDFAKDLIDEIPF